MLAFVGCGVAHAAVTWSLVEHFPFATPVVEPTVIDVGTPAARPSLGAGWSYDEASGDQTWAWGVGLRSVVAFHLNAPRALTLAMRGHPLEFADAPPQSVTVVLNGTPGPQVSLAGGEASYEVALPLAAARAGDNLLELRYAYARAPSDVFGTADRRPLAVAWDLIRFAGTEPAPVPQVDRASDVLTLAGGAVLRFHVRLPRDAVLHLGDVAFSGAEPGELSVYLRKDGENDALLARLEPGSGVREIRIPERFAGVVRLSLAMGGGASTSGIWLTHPRVEWSGASPTPAPPVRRRPNVVVYLVDTLRADRLGCYGGLRVASPSVDAFAADSVRFADAMTEVPWTRPSVASLFTGLPPRTHGVNGRMDALPVEATTMAELFARAGYETAAFVTNGNVAPMYGFAQGFQTYELLPGAEIPVGDGVVTAPLPDSAEVTRRALDWLDRRDSSRPFLLYLHTADPHGPYLRLEPFRARVGAPSEPTDLGSPENMRLLHEGKLPVDARLVRSLLALYDSKIVQNDEQFGAVLAALRARGLYDDALVVFTADHGEEFYEHGGWEHGRTVHREVEHVPLLIKLPGAERAGTRRDETVQLEDVLPTLLAWLDPDDVPPLPGVRLLGGPPPDAPRTAFAYLGLDGIAADAVVEGRWKLIVTRDATRLFDRNADPGEERDVAADHPVVLGYLRARLAEHVAAAGPTLPHRTAMFTDQVRRNLQALGYVP